MRYNMPLGGIYLLYCYFSVVFADDDFSKFEKEMQSEPPGIGHPSDQTAVYSRASDKALDKAIETQLKSVRNKIISEPEMNEFDPYLKINKDGIKVYIYSHKNSLFGTFKAITHINASLDSIIAVILDIESSTEWLDACEKSFLIKKLSFTEQYHYQIFTIPFPFKNRDFIFHSTMQHDPLSNAITITMSSAPDYCIDKQSEKCQEANQSGLVRVNKSIGTLKLEPDDKGTKITWIQHTDPAGHLPAWLVNLLVKKTPYRSLIKLTEKVKEEKYKLARLIYDNNGVAVAINTRVSL